MKHKRTTPKVFAHAKELHRNLTPLLQKPNSGQDYERIEWLVFIFGTNMPLEIM